MATMNQKSSVVQIPKSVHVRQFAQSQPVKNDGKTTAHIDSCGNLYETGYRLEGNELRFPGGGLHRLPDGNQEEAERILRETYGLQGERDKLIRTKW
jgi:hypothetical protein